jgi:hypothetical protein
MNTFRFTPVRLSTAVLIAVAAMSGMAAAQTEVKQPAAARITATVPLADRNAALMYLKACLNLPKDLSEKIGEVDYDTCGTTTEALEANEKFKAALALAETFKADEWVVASKQTKCDFEFAREEGMFLLLPHLGKFRVAARSLRFLARHEGAAGNVEVAADYLASVIRMGNHITTDGFLISNLVAEAIDLHAMDEMKLLAKNDRVTASALNTMLSALDTIDSKDPLLMKQSIESERDTMFASIASKCTGPQAGELLANQIIPMQDRDDAAATVRRQIIERMDEKAIAEDIRLGRKAYDDLLAVWDEPNALERFGTIETEIAANKYGVLASAISPSLSRVKSSIKHFEKNLKEVRAALHEAHGVEASPATP